MRIRSIRPEFWRSEDIEALDIPTRLLFIGLWSYVDDNGVGLDRVSNIAADLFAGDLSREAPETVARVSDGLDALAKNGQISRYDSGGRHYLYIDGWDRNQRVDKPTPGRFPRPDGTLNRTDAPARENPANDSRAPRERRATTSGQEQGNRGTGEKRKRGASARSAPLSESWRPSDDDIAWALEARPDIDHQRVHDVFREHYLDSGITRADWSKAWRTWMTRERSGDGTPPPAPPPRTPTDAPEWCGECDPEDRTYETPSGAIAKCPHCHPIESRRFE